ncbi:MAG: adenylyl-sulfate kinase [bacterium]
MPFAIWMTGLPGSGKSTVAGELMKNLKDTEYLRLDEIRKKYIKEPKFTDEERESVYSKFIEEGILNIGQGRNVVYDATAHKLKWRNKARHSIKNFIEAHVKCPLQVCIERESKRSNGLVTAELYKKSLERKRTGKQFKGLGQVVGVDVPFEENKNVEIEIDSEKTGPKEAASAIFDEIKKRGWV